MAKKKIRTYNEKEYKEIYEIIHEYFLTYKTPNILKESMENFKNNIKAENDFSTIAYNVCKDLYEEGYR